MRSRKIKQIIYHNILQSRERG